MEFGDEGLQIRGDLTIRGKTCPVVLDAEFDGACPDPMGDATRPRIGFSATTTIDRYEFGVTFNHPLETGGLLLSKLISVELDVQAVLQ